MSGRRPPVVALVAAGAALALGAGLLAWRALEPSPPEPTPARVSRDPARDAFTRGVTRFDNGDLLGALSEFLEVLQYEPKNAEALNNAAWILAVVDDDATRDPDRALAMASLAVKYATPEALPLHLDTEAAAYAATGRYDAAAAAQWHALKVWGDAAPGTARDRLETYERGEAWRGPR